MSIISQTTWDKFTQEEKEKIRKEFALLKDTEGEDLMHRVTELMVLFPEEALQPQPLTYEDVAEELFDGEDTFYISDIGSIVLAEGGRLIYDKYKLPNNCTSRKQAEKLLAINKLLNVAAYLNKGWKPDWSNNEDKWSLCVDPDTNKVKTIKVYHSEVNRYVVYFRTEQIARQAVQILGEDTVRLALGNY